MNYMSGWLQVHEHRPKTALTKRENSPVLEAEAASNIQSLHLA